MKYLKKISLIIGIMIITILFSTFLITLLNYFDILNKNVVSIFKIIIIVVALFVGGFFMGKRSNQKGWLEGFKLSLIFIVVLFLVNIIGFHNSFELKNILYYLILIVSSIFGSMLGINRIKKN